MPEYVNTTDLKPSLKSVLPTLASSLFLLAYGARADRDIQCIKELQM
jgi:hypothetical protein